MKKQVIAAILAEILLLGCFDHRVDDALQNARGAYSRRDYGTAITEYQEVLQRAGEPPLNPTASQKSEALNGLCKSDYAGALHYETANSFPLGSCRACLDIAAKGWNDADEACRAAPDEQTLLTSIRMHQQQVEKQIEAQENPPPPPPETPEQKRVQQQAKLLLCDAMMEYLLQKPPFVYPKSKWTPCSGAYTSRKT
jgi:hypothetical protein